MRDPVAQVVPLARFSALDAGASSITALAGMLGAPAPLASLDDEEEVAWQEFEQEGKGGYGEKVPGPLPVTLPSTPGGAIVRDVQAQLAIDGGDLGPKGVDGIWGPKSQAAWNFVTGDELNRENVSIYVQYDYQGPMSVFNIKAPGGRPPGPVGPRPPEVEPPEEKKEGLSWQFWALLAIGAAAAVMVGVYVPIDNKLRGRR